jgi:Flp pilus assembly protein TadD
MRENKEAHGEVVKSPEKAIVEEAIDPRMWYQKGVALRKMGRYEEAVEALDRAVELEPSNADAWRNRGVALNQLGRFEDALESCSRARPWTQAMQDVDRQGLCSA